jgi:protein-S-isoprenylcysteine O-methyltransferase Ste14
MSISTPASPRPAAHPRTVRHRPTRALTHVGQLCFRFRNAAAPALLAIIVVLATDRSFLVGAALMLAGLALRVAVLGAVGIRRSGRHRRMVAPRLHESGPYGCCRHPLYLANGLLLVEHLDRAGVLLWEGAPVAFVAVWLALSAAYLWVRLLKWGGRLDAAPAPTPLPWRALPVLGDDGGRS